MAASLKHLDSDGATVISAMNWADAVAGVLLTPKKFGVENNGDRTLSQLIAALVAVGGGDGASLMRIGLDTVTCSRPFNLAAVLGAAGAGGVWGATGVYGWVVAATNANGETIASAEVTVNVDVTTKKVTLTWNVVTGAAGYKVYRTATPGTYGASTLRATIGSGVTVTFIDDGSATSTGTPALINTTGGWNLSLVLSAPADGGVWGATGLYYYRVAAFSVDGELLTVSQENSINVNDTTKRVTVSWSAVTGATSYKVYRSTLSGVFTSALRVTQAGLSFIDNGTATGAGNLTEDQGYGVPPTLTPGPISIGDTLVTQESFYWINWVTLASTPEAGNPRAGLVAFSENV